MAQVVLPRSLAALYPGVGHRLEVSASTVAELIHELDRRMPGLADRLTEGAVLRTHLNVFVAGSQATIDTRVAPDDVVHIIPAVSGG